MIVDVATSVWQKPQQLGAAALRRLAPSDRTPWDRLDGGVAAHERAIAEVDAAIVHGLHCRHAGAQIGHKEVAAAVDRQPEKLIGFAGIDPLAPAPLECLDHAASLGLAGVSLCPAAQNMHPCHSRAMDLYEQCEKRAMPLYIHGGDLFANVSIMAFARSEHFDEVARTFANLRLVIAQIGRPWIEPTLELVCRHRHVYADISGLINHPWQLYHALMLAHEYGADNKLLLASGFPFCTPQQAIINLYSVNRFTNQTHLPHVPRPVLHGIVERDALRCLGLEPPAKLGTPPPVSDKSPITQDTSS